VHILVTGGCGFVGSELALRFREHGHRVVVMDNLVRRGSESNLDRLKHHDVSFVHGDVRNAEDFNNLPRDIDFVCDTSAQPSVVIGYSNPVFDITNNALGVVHVLEFVRHRRCPLLFFSSNRVYGADRINALPRKETSTRFEWDAAAWQNIPADQRPRGFDPVHGVSEEFSIDGGQRSIYGLSKLMADAACQEYAQAFDLPIVVNRFGVISGAGQFGKADQGFVVWWAIAHYFGLPLKYIGWGGKQVRDVLFFDDVWSLVQTQLNRISTFRGDVFNLGGGAANSLSLLETTRLVESGLGRSIPIPHEPAVRAADIALYYTDNRKAERVLGWKPAVTLNKGFDLIFSWIRQHESELRARYAQSR
jgi:CDP-paratose 2-epimerase